MFRAAGMSVESAVRRVQTLKHVLGSGNRLSILRLSSTSTSDKEYVTIGNVSTEVKTPNHPELVPFQYLPKEKVPQSLLSHLRWIMQKDVLGQDVFLIGPPGPLRRTLAMMYLEMTKKEAEYISLSRDTTETDLKQRREISSGTAYHIDQCAVRAATEGRVLILEGIEKAERNVLPVLNNLLENREMQLDDGRFLMAAERYDKLLQDHTQEELDKWKLVRVDESFRVIALGLPVPRYRGNPLDPPLRSRFQARDVNQLPFKDHLEVLNSVGADVTPDRLSQVLSFASTLKSEEANSLGLPDFPLDNLYAITKIMNVVPHYSLAQLLERLYPHDVMLGKEGQTAVKDALKTFELLESEVVAPPSGRVLEVRRQDGSAAVELTLGPGVNNVQVPCGGLDVPLDPSQRFINTSYHDDLLTQMMLSHSVTDFCIIGPRGCGKTVLVKHFADLLGYHIEPIMLYQDMTSRDLLQQRTTLPNGDTTWRPSPLVTAALEGSLAVLDGVHRVNPGTFAVMHRLIHDRELSLFDGTRLLRHDRYDAIKEENSYSDADMTDKGILRIDPSFRIIALSEPPVIGSATQQWLNSELLTMFLYHNMRSLTQEEEYQVLHKLVPNLSNMTPLLDLTHKLRDLSDANLKSVASSLSTRQLFRIAKRLSRYPDEDLYDTVQRACLSQFLPRLTRTALEEELEHLGVKKPEQHLAVDAMDRAISCEVKDGTLRIGNTQAPVFSPDNKMKVPDILFYENPQHLAVMENMLKDYLLGEHLLLVGNQGVGKNKIVDRFLQLLNRPREYLQLHRDTTVQTLTLQPTVQDGVILYEDSPLVRAVKLGHILVVDEADKAPTNVTCILKTLVESGEMHLSDGRRIVSCHSGIPASDRVIVAHPNFRMFVLANRPGFPFLGNDFFGAMGDIFSCHAVDNPDTESEMSMLRQYGPEVPEHLLRKLVLAFGDLRNMADQGLITYPYSTREVVNMVKHLQRFPDEGLVSVVKNVFDFDSYNKEYSDSVMETLQKHGIPIGANPKNIHLAKEYALPPMMQVGQWDVKRSNQSGITVLPVDDKQLRIKGPVQMGVSSYNLDRTEARSMLFTEQEAYWTIPMHETGAIVDVAVTKGSQRQPGTINPDIIHIATANPICIYTMNPKKQHLTCVDLYDVFPSSTVRSTSYRPRIHIAPLGFPLDNTIVIHEEVSNILLSVNTETGEVTRLETSSLIEAATDKISKTFRANQGSFKMCSDFAHESDGLLLLYKQEGNTVDIVNMLEGRCHTVSLPFKVDKVLMASRFDWLIETADKSKFLVSSTQEEPFKYVLQTLDAKEQAQYFEVTGVSNRAMHDTQLSVAIGQELKSPHRVLLDREHYVSLAVGLPELSTVDLYTSQRRDDDVDTNYKDRAYNALSGLRGQIRARDPVAYLPDSGQVIRALPTHKVPQDVYPEGVRPRYLSGYLEVSDPVNKVIRYIPVPGVLNQNIYSQWYDGASDVNIVMANMSHDGLVTVDSGGCVRLWETAIFNLNQSLKNWRALLDGEENKKLEITRELGKVPDGPKHGLVDPLGKPHVGGGMFAGGVGGMNTAGMGGMGGPYRLDLGHEITQVPDWEKEMVPQEVQQAAREMAQKAYKERLKQIQMSEYDGDLYERYAENVRAQVKSLRVILDSLQAKGKERQWINHQMHGDLDDAKLIEGLTGEKAIYKRRGEKEPEMGSPQQKPKLIRLLCDVSGSMYRFNGYDGRLEREMESMLMVMEALESYEHKVKYEIIGHSGEGHKFDFVKASKPPKNNKERLDAIKTLHAHSQFCISGDNTLEAAEHAIKTITDEEADEHFVIVLSDANLARYGISPKHLSNVLTSNEDVNAYVIFIGSLGDQASRLMKKMPSGRAFLCLDTKNLPHILQQIFTSTMLNTR